MTDFLRECHVIDQQKSNKYSPDTFVKEPYISAKISVFLPAGSRIFCASVTSAPTPLPAAQTYRKP